MKRLLALFVFAASFAAAQSLPVGTPTEVKVTHMNKGSLANTGCEGVLQYIFATACQQQVIVEAASSNSLTTSFAIVLLFTDQNGTLQSKTQFTSTRDNPTSPYFTTTFTGVDNIVIVSVIAVPQVSDGQHAATVTNVP